MTVAHRLEMVISKLKTVPPLLVEFEIDRYMAARTTSWIMREGARGVSHRLRDGSPDPAVAPYWIWVELAVAQYLLSRVGPPGEMS